MNKFLVFILVITFIIGRSCFAVQSKKQTNGKKNNHHSFTIKQCIDIAIKKNPDISKKKWDIKSAIETKNITKSSLGFQGNFIGSYMHHLDTIGMSKTSRPGELLSFTDDIATGAMVLKVPIYTGGKLRNKHEASIKAIEYVKYQFIRSKRELVYNVSLLFYSILGQKKVIESMSFSRKALIEHRNIVKDLLLAQKTAKVDLLRTEVRIADIEQHILHEKNVLNTKRFMLTNLMGLDSHDHSFKISGQLTLSNKKISNLDYSTLFYKRQDYRSLNSKIKIQRKLLRIAKKGRSPDVYLQATYGKNWSLEKPIGNSSESEDFGQIGVTMSFPVFDGGRINANKRLEYNRLKSLEEDLRKLRLQIKLELEIANSNIESTHARVNVTQKSTEQAKESLRIEREKYNLGKGVVVDVLDAQSALLDVQKSYYRALADYNTALEQFKLAKGVK